MKPISSNVSKGCPVGTYVRCIDNTGADIIQIIAVKGFKGVKRRRAECGVAGPFVGAVKKGDPKIKHEVVQCVLVRQKKPWRRPNGMRIMFEDNAAVLINERSEPRGTRLKGPIAREVVERFSAIGKIASTVV